MFTREHWEASWVARAFPIARGWERQTDLDANSVLYRGLSAGSYRRWLDDNAVSLVALPDVALDAGGQAEAKLLAHPPSYLQPVWADAHWRVWRVRNHALLLQGPAVLTHLGPASVTVRFRHPGSPTLRIRADPMWAVSSGPACVDVTTARWLQVRARAAGVVVLRARATLGSVTGRPARG